MKIIISLLLLLGSNVLFSQKVHIVGDISQFEISELMAFFSNTYTESKPKKIEIFCGESKLPFHIIKRKSFIFDLSVLSSKLNELDCNNPGGINPKNIKRFKTELNSRYNKAILTYSNNGANTPPLDFNDLNNYSDYIRSLKKPEKSYVYLLVFSKPKPEVKINTPTSKQTIKLIEISGTASSKREGIERVIVRINNSNWNVANGTDDWSFQYIQNDIPSGKLKVEAIAIDNQGDSSDIHLVKDVVFEYSKIDMNKIKYVYPSAYQNVVRKCIDDNAFMFNFKISIEDKNIDKKFLYLVFENANGSEIRNELVDRFLVNSGSKSLGSTEYCFYLTYTFLNFANACSMNQEENFYYYFVYKKDPNNVLKSEKVLIHFSSFDSNIKEKDCTCD